MGCNSCNKKKENFKKQETQEGFSDVSNFLSNNWIFVVIGLIIIIGLIYFFILRPKSDSQEFVLAPPGFVRGRLDDYTVDM
jgi:hypothetical protein